MAVRWFDGQRWRDHRSGRNLHRRQSRKPGVWSDPSEADGHVACRREGGVRNFQVARITATNLAPIIARHVHPDSRFMTDESNVYAHAGSWYAEHQTVNHSAKDAAG